MKFGPRKSALYALFLSLVLACARSDPGHQAQPAPLALTRAQAIQQFFGGRRLAPVEGIWTETQNEFEVAIVRDTTGRFPGYQFVGYIIDTRQRGWKSGEVKVLAKESSSDRVYVAEWIRGNRERVGTTLGLVNDNLLTTVGEPYASLIRAYPTYR